MIMKMKILTRFLIIAVVLLTSSCGTSSPYLVYDGDVYLSGKKVYENVNILDKQTPNEIFFYDKNKNGHLLMGDVVVKNTSDTVYVKR